MDSRLKLILNGDPKEVLMLLIRLKNPDAIVPYCKVITRIGDIITCRVQRRYLLEVYHCPEVFSVKAPRLILATQTGGTAPADLPQPSRRLQLPYTGAGVFFAAIDWGFDFAHANLRNPDGTTRFACIWDQNGKYDNNMYGYGCFYFSKQINEALQGGNAYERMGYHPGSNDITGAGMHGTHVMDIGTGTPAIGEGGIATGTTYIAVQLGSNLVNGSDLALGDSVRLVEALHFIRTAAYGAPCVINMSLGSHGDSHTGRSLVELAMDQFVEQNPGFAIVQSVGNYYSSHCHLGYTLRQGASYDIEWNVPRGNFPNEVEIWYPGSDEFSIRLVTPNGEVVVESDPFRDIHITRQGSTVGYIFHRRQEPNTGLNHIDIILDGRTPKGKWIIQLTGKLVKDGRFNAYCERNDISQARFSPHQSSGYTTTGSVCNGKHSITVGAYDHNDAAKPVVRFSSSGPTAMGQSKPDLLAPGYKISAARSAPALSSVPTDDLTVKSGSSMAAPHVAGSIALLFEKHLPARLSITDTKKLLFDSLDPLPGSFSSADKTRAGFGILNTARLLEATQPAVVMIGEGSREKDSSLSELPPVPFDVYRHFHPSYPFSNDSSATGFIPVALPGKKLSGVLMPGDIVLRRFVLSGQTRQFIVADSLLQSRAVSTNAGRRSGHYISTRSGGDIRIAGVDRILPYNTMVLRAIDPAEAAGALLFTEDAGANNNLRYKKYGKGGGYVYLGSKTIDYATIIAASGLDGLEGKMALHFLETEGGIDAINAYDNQWLTWGFGFAGRSGNLTLALFNLLSGNEAAKNDFEAAGITLSSPAVKHLSITADGKGYTDLEAIRFWKNSTTFLNILIALTQKYPEAAFSAQWRAFKNIHRSVFTAFADTDYLSGITNETEKQKAKTAVLHAHHHYPGYNPPRSFRHAGSFEAVLQQYVTNIPNKKQANHSIGVWRKSLDTIFGAGVGTNATETEAVIDPADERIDVRAKFSLQRLLRQGGAAAADAEGMIDAINTGFLAGIWGDDLQKSALIARQLGTQRWLLVPKGKDAELVNADSVAPSIIFREGLPAPRLDAGLRSAWASFLMRPGPQLPVLQFGDSGPSVSYLQQSLNSYRDNRINFVQGGDLFEPLNTDGMFGRLTRNAVVVFQGLEGLVKDGIVGAQSWLKLLQPPVCQPTATIVNWTPIHADELSLKGTTFSFGGLSIYVPPKARENTAVNKIVVFFTANNVIGSNSGNDFITHGLRGAADASDWIVIGLGSPGDRPARPDFEVITTAKIQDCLRALCRSTTITSIRLAAHSRGHRGLTRTLMGNDNDNPAIPLETAAMNTPFIDVNLIDKIVVYDAFFTSARRVIAKLKIDPAKVTVFKVTDGIGANPSSRFVDLTGRVAQIAGLGCIRFIQGAALTNPAVPPALAASPIVASQLPMLTPVRGSFSSLLPLPPGKLDYGAFVKTTPPLRTADLLAFFNNNNLVRFRPFVFNTTIAAHHLFVAEFVHELFT